MKRITIIATLSLILSLISVNLFAQSESGSEKSKKHHSHWKHSWPGNDSSGMYNFSGSFKDCSFSDFPQCRKKGKYNGHWAGIDLGFSGYLTPDFDMNYGAASPYLDMNSARSLVVNVNPFELNLNLIKNHVGFTTGIGFSTANYYFTGNRVMLSDSSTLKAYRIQDEKGNLVGLDKNKLVVSHLNVPLLFEYQTNPYRRLSSFHFSLGVIAGVRIGSYTKQVYQEKDGQYFLVDDQGQKVATYDVKRHVVRTKGSYHLSPFKMDATVRIGWSYLKLYGTYSLTSMFQKDKGPEVYPFSVGITLAGW